MNQSAVETFKDILGEIPYTAELYWMLRSPNKPIRSRFTLANLQKAFTSGDCRSGSSG